MRPSLFIVGCARSGTTLLQRMMGAHPRLAMTPSMHWVRDLFREHGVRRPDDPVPENLVRALLAHPRFGRLRIDRGAVERLAETTPTHAALLAGIFGLCAEAEGKPLVGNKTAPFVRRIPELHRMWHEARFAHIVRDGRDVCLSVMGWESVGSAVGRYALYNENPVCAIALWWRRKVLLGREGGERVGANLYREVHYEDLVSDPERECRALCSFLEIPYDSAMLRFHELSGVPDPDLERVHPTLPIRRGMRDWREEMESEAAERFEAAAGDLLEELGYPRSTVLDRGAMEHAARARASFTRDALARGQKLPKGW